MRTEGEAPVSRAATRLRAWALGLARAAEWALLLCLTSFLIALLAGARVARRVMELKLQGTSLAHWDLAHAKASFANNVLPRVTHLALLVALFLGVLAAVAAAAAFHATPRRITERSAELSPTPAPPSWSRGRALVDGLLLAGLSVAALYGVGMGWAAATGRASSVQGGLSLYGSLLAGLSAAGTVGALCRTPAQRHALFLVLMLLGFVLGEYLEFRFEETPDTSLPSFTFIFMVLSFLIAHDARLAAHGR